MNAQATSTRSAVAGGIALIALGAVALLAQLNVVASAGILIVPMLAIIFLAWGLLTRSFGLVIPGGILAGIGLGIVLVENASAWNEETTGGLFLLCFAAGWLLISLLSLLTSSGFQWWPLIPSGILAAVGGLLIAGDAGLKVLQVAGYAWPLALVAAGVWVLIKRRA